MPKPQILNSKYYTKSLNSLWGTLKLASEMSSQASAPLSTFLSSKIPHNSPSISEHSRAFPTGVPNTVLPKQHAQVYHSNSPFSGADFCPSLLSIAVIINTMTKSNLRGKEFISHYSLQCIMKESLSRNLEAGTKAETTEDHCLPVCPPMLA